MKTLKRTEGFTLVELMIVLSIIAILAVVLVPKVGDMKDSVREQGVYSNMNSVRAYLELKVNSRVAGNAAEADRIADATNGLMTQEFTAGNAITNPFTNGDQISEWGNQNSANHSVQVYGGYNYAYSAANFEANANYTGTYLDRRGKVIIFVYTDAYVIFGYDSDGLALPYQIVR